MSAQNSDYSSLERRAAWVVRAVSRLDGPVLAHHSGHFELLFALVDTQHADDAPAVYQL